jgi:hypothetical protein
MGVKMTRFVKYSIATLVLACLGFAAGSALAADLQYKNHAQGVEYTYTLTVTKGLAKTIVDVKRSVVSVSGNNLTIDTSFANARMERGGIVQPLDSMNGPATRTVMDIRGVVQSVTALGELAQRSNDLGVAVNRDIMASLAVSSFPANDVPVGQGWTKTATAGNDNATFTYTVQAENVTRGAYNDCARISVTSAFNLSQERDITQTRSTSYTLGSVSVNGNIYFSVGAGRIVEVDLTTDYKTLDVTVDYNGRARITPDESTVTANLVLQ